MYLMFCPRRVDYSHAASKDTENTQLVP